MKCDGTGLSLSFTTDIARLSVVGVAPQQLPIVTDKHTAIAHNNKLGYNPVSISQHHI